MSTEEHIQHQEPLESIPTTYKTSTRLAILFFPATVVNLALYFLLIKDHNRARDYTSRRGFLKWLYKLWFWLTTPQPHHRSHWAAKENIQKINPRLPYAAEYDRELKPYVPKKGWIAGRKDYEIIWKHLPGHWRYIWWLNTLRRWLGLPEESPPPSEAQEVSRWLLTREEVQEAEAAGKNREAGAVESKDLSQESLREKIEYTAVPPTVEQFGIPWSGTNSEETLVEGNSVESDPADPLEAEPERGRTRPRGLTDLPESDIAHRTAIETQAGEVAEDPLANPAPTTALETVAETCAEVVPKPEMGTAARAVKIESALTQAGSARFGGAAAIERLESIGTPTGDAAGIDEEQDSKLPLPEHGRGTDTAGDQLAGDDSGSEAEPCWPTRYPRHRPRGLSALGQEGIRPPVKLLGRSVRDPYPSNPRQQRLHRVTRPDNLDIPARRKRTREEILEKERRDKEAARERRKDKYRRRQQKPINSRCTRERSRQRVYTPYGVQPGEARRNRNEGVPSGPWVEGTWDQPWEEGFDRETREMGRVAQRPPELEEQGWGDWLRSFLPDHGVDAGGGPPETGQAETSRPEVERLESGQPEAEKPEVETANQKRKKNRRKRPTESFEFSAARASNNRRKPREFEDDETAKGPGIGRSHSEEENSYPRMDEETVQSDPEDDKLTKYRKSTIRDLQKTRTSNPWGRPLVEYEKRSAKRRRDATRLLEKRARGEARSRGENEDHLVTARYLRSRNEETGVPDSDNGTFQATQHRLGNARSTPHGVHQARYLEDLDEGRRHSTTNLEATNPVSAGELRRGSVESEQPWEDLRWNQEPWVTSRLGRRMGVEIDWGARRHSAPDTHWPAGEGYMSLEREIEEHSQAEVRLNRESGSRATTRRR